ncbi:MAG: biotin/lipoyl-containing protein, partial [Actinomycetota bacterium]
KGPETTWHPIAAGPDLESVEGFGDTYNVAAYPGGDWKAPRKGERLADLEGADDTASELNALKPVLETFVATTVSPIAGKRKEVEPLVQGSVGLKPGSFKITGVEMREGSVNGKPSIVAMARAVPSGTLGADSLGEGVEEGVIKRLIAKEGDSVTSGDPILEVETTDGMFTVEASKAGKLIEFTLRPGDKIKPGNSVATIDLSGQAGQPAPVEVAGARVRGSVRTPPLFYLLGAVLLFAFHIFGLSRAEKARKPQPELA